MPPHHLQDQAMHRTQIPSSGRSHLYLWPQEASRHHPQVEVRRGLTEGPPQEQSQLRSHMSSPQILV